MDRGSSNSTAGHNNGMASYPYLCIDAKGMHQCEKNLEFLTRENSDDDHQAAPGVPVGFTLHYCNHDT